jgi:hypothetical protein
MMEIKHAQIYKKVIKKNLSRVASFLAQRKRCTIERNTICSTQFQLTDMSHEMIHEFITF